jgi:OmpA-OmpF porin, OOP family
LNLTNIEILFNIKYRRENCMTDQKDIRVSDGGIGYCLQTGIKRGEFMRGNCFQIKTLLAVLVIAVSLLVGKAAAQESTVQETMKDTGQTVKDTAQDMGEKTMEGAKNLFNIATDEKVKIKGLVIRKDGNTLYVRDNHGRVTRVLLTPETEVKDGERTYGLSNVMQGLIMEVKGRGNENGDLVASKINLKKSDLRAAVMARTMVEPVEETANLAVAGVQENSKRIDENSQQISENSQQIGAAKQGIEKNSQQIQTVNQRLLATNERISDLDDYDVRKVFTVTFPVDGFELSAEAKAQLDKIAAQAPKAENYLVEIAGFTDSTGTEQWNKDLSQRRADAVVQYLVLRHNIPARRIVFPIGYGSLQPVSDNTTSEGRARNRRAEIRILVNKGLVNAEPPMMPNP